MVDRPNSTDACLSFTFLTSSVNPCHLDSTLSSRYYFILQAVPLSSTVNVSLINHFLKHFYTVWCWNLLECKQSVQVCVGVMSSDSDVTVSLHFTHTSVHRCQLSTVFLPVTNLFFSVHRYFPRYVVCCKNAIFSPHLNFAISLFRKFAAF